MTTYTNDGLTITFCECGENHIGNQKIGQVAKEGFTYTDLQNIKDDLAQYSIKCELTNLGDYLPQEYGKIDTGVLIIRNGANIFVKPPDLLWEELRNLTYDKHALMYGKVCQKHARHNLCFSDVDQTAKYEEGKGTIISFAHIPYLSHMRNNLSILLGTKANNLVAEANYYYNVDKCGIGYHGDAERKIVVGLRLGKSFPLSYYWHMGKTRISQKIEFNLNHGDIYVMDEKTCGFDYKRKIVPTLRHAAGCDKYTK